MTAHSRPGPRGRAARRTRGIAAIIAVAIAASSLAACGSTPVAVDNKVPLPASPSRIVSLSPTATETLFAIGAGQQVLAVDNQSNFPAEAPRTKLSAFNLSVEAVAKFKPDLVVMSFDTTAGKNALDAFAKLKIPVLLQPAAEQIGDVYQQIEELGAATGRSKKAKELVRSMKEKIAAIVKNAAPEKGLKLFHEVDNTLYSATSETFIGRIYADFGVTNIADAAAGADNNGYPQLTNEMVVQQNPTVIFLGDVAYGESAETVAARPGWGAIDAVVNGRIIALDSDVAQRWGPRVVDLYEAIAAGIPSVM